MEKPGHNIKSAQPGYSDEVTKRLQELCSFVSQSKSPSYISFLAYIDRLLKQFHLTTYHTTDVFHETYQRTANSIIDGQEIVNLRAWMRGTSLNVVREFSRQEKRQQQIPNRIQPTYESNFDGDNSIEIKIQKLTEACCALSNEELKIYEAKYLKGKSWLEVQKELNLNYSDSALRKKGERILKKIRKHIN